MAISVDSMEDSVAFASKLSITFPLLHDAGLKTALAYGVAMEGDEIAVPAVFIVSRDLRIVYRHVGESIVDRPSAESLLDELDKLSAPAAAAAP